MTLFAVPSKQQFWIADTLWIWTTWLSFTMVKKGKMTFTWYSPVGGMGIFFSFFSHIFHGHIFHGHFVAWTREAAIAPIYWVTLCPWRSLLVQHLSTTGPVCIIKSPFYHKSLTMESAVILRPKGSTNPQQLPQGSYQSMLLFSSSSHMVSSENGSSMEGCCWPFCFSAYVTGVTDASRDQELSLELRLHLVTVPLLFLCLLAWYTTMLPNQLLSFAICSLIRLSVFT